MGNLAKTLALVGLAAGGGAFVGGKLADWGTPKLPESARTPGAAAGIRVGAQAATAVGLYAVLQSIF